MAVIAEESVTLTTMEFVGVEPNLQVLIGVKRLPDLGAVAGSDNMFYLRLTPLDARPRYLGEVLTLRLLS